MTDKQIIIDKLKNDVACQENIINHLAEYNIKLENKLQAKKQECKKLKNERTVDLVKQLDQLKAEKEEIKKYLGISSKTIMERLEELQEFRDNDKYKLYQAEQTLVEIKEIAKNNFYYLDCDYRWILEQILQKISECEVLDDRE